MPTDVAYNTCCYMSKKMNKVKKKEKKESCYAGSH